MYLATESQVLVFSLWEINCAQTAEHFPNDVISGVTIKTQNHKVQRNTLYKQGVQYKLWGYEDSNLSDCGSMWCKSPVHVSEEHGCIDSCLLDLALVSV
jgi:hypothetical protein